MFNSYSKYILNSYIAFLRANLNNDSNSLNKPLDDLYQEYTIRDNNFPRPILTFLGVNALSDTFNDITHFKDVQITFIPQLIRDFLAIHDDIIDEDLIKFNNDTLPFAFSKLEQQSVNQMSKWGKDIALLYADFQITLPFTIINNLKVSDDIKVKIYNLVCNVLKVTNQGQIEELLLNHRKLEDISLDNICCLYKKKAADYCYAFPLALGMTYSGYDSQLICETRDILLDIGMFSQIVNDIEGVFFESFSNERNTLSDLLLLRRTYLLIKLRKQLRNENEISLLNNSELTYTQALMIKQLMVDYKVLSDTISEIRNGCKSIIKRIENAKLGLVLKNHLLNTIDNRILNNIAKI